jgi:hypothetical protein
VKLIFSIAALVVLVMAVPDARRAFGDWYCATNKKNSGARIQEFQIEGKKEICSTKFHRPPARHFCLDFPIAPEFNIL